MLVKFLSKPLGGRKPADLFLNRQFVHYFTEPLSDFNDTSYIMVLELTKNLSTDKTKQQLLLRGWEDWFAPSEPGFNSNWH